MSDELFKKALDFTLKWEGGFVNHPNDYGGATNKGITQEKYDIYRHDKNLEQQSVGKLNDEEMKEIYLKYYWEKAKCDRMKEPLSLVHFDTAVNFGVEGATEFLQEALNVKVDRDWGTQTEKAFTTQNHYDLAETICYGRLSYRDLRVMEDSTQGVFHKGWINRDIDLLNETKKYENNPSTDIREVALRIAELEKPPEGYNTNMEVKGENRGPQVDRYLATTGYYTGEGDAWCSAFVYYCIKMACYKLGIKEIPYEREGIYAVSCPKIDEWARKNNIFYHNTPERGDAFLLVDSISAYHIGFVTNVNGDDVYTIEGNTNDDGSANGIGIFKNTRPNNSNIKFVKWWQLAGKETPSTPHPSYELFVGEEKISNIPEIQGKAYAPVRLLGEKLGYKVDWKQTEQAAFYNNYRVTSGDTLKIDNVLYAPVRSIVNSVDELEIKVSGQKVIITKKM